MKTLLRRHRKQLLAVGLTLLFAALASLGAIVLLDWPIWAGLFLFLLQAGLLGAGLVCWRWGMRRLDRRYAFAREAEGQATASETSSSASDACFSIETRWNFLLSQLGCTSRLKKDRRYLVPWYLMFGAPGSGKSTILAALPAGPAVDAVDLGKDPATEDEFDWKVLDQAVVMKCPGRYASPRNDLDRDQWQKFLSLLASHRSKAPLNGLVVTIGADRLLETETAQIQEEGRALRQRIHEVMRALGLTIPVYVLVTKCDRIPGMDQCFSYLSETERAQAMGALKLRGEIGSFVDDLMSAVEERLHALRLRLMAKAEMKPRQQGLLLFPREFGQLHPKLAPLVEAVFAVTPYSETPWLRGLFFASAAPGVKPATSPSQRESTCGTGSFLDDLFARVLPRDPAPVAPTARALRWRFSSYGIALLSWSLLFVALSGMAALSFVKNLSAIRQIPPNLVQPINQESGLSLSLEEMEQFRREVLRVEQHNAHWMVPRFGLTASLEIERALKKKYCRSFEKVFLSRLDQELAAALNERRLQRSPREFAQTAVHLLRRINLVKASIAATPLPELQKRALPPPPPAQLMGNRVPAATSSALFGPLLIHYLAWNPHPQNLADELKKEQAALRQLLSDAQGDIEWLVLWVDEQEGVAPVTLSDFWGSTAARDTMIRPSFTRKGMERLEALAGELEAALNEPRQADLRGEIEKRYLNATMAAWQAFAAAFPSGTAERGEDRAAWQKRASLMATGQGPYLSFLDRLCFELEPVVSSRPVPDWLEQIFLLQKARAVAAISGQGAVGKAAAKGRELWSQVGSRLAGGSASQNLEPQQELVKTWQQYQTALGAMAAALDSRPHAFQLATQSFSEEGAGKDAVASAHQAAVAIRGALGGKRPVSDLTWNLVRGPFDYLWSHLREEAAANLQAQWEEQVVAVAAGIPAQQATGLLLGPDGLAWKFVKGPAAPFLVRTPGGFRAKEVLGGTVPLAPALFSYLGKGTQVMATALSKQNSYSVGIRGLPTEANPDAKIHPHATRLELVCAGGIQSLVNQNYPVGRTFSWSPDSCSEVLFQIEVGDLVLTKRYNGLQAFPEFLRDFPGGIRAFSVREFPGERKALEGMGIRQIRATYQFTGSSSVIKQSMSGSEVPLPKTIGRSR